jgi:hypothetical protein
MSNWLVRGCVATVLVAATSAGFTAQESRTLAVSATVPGGCTLTTSGPMAFGTLDMSSTANESKQVTATYKCATGITVGSFTVGGQTTGPFAGTMTALSPTNTDTIPYSIAWTAPTPYQGEGFAVVGKQVVLDGTVLNADYITKRPDSYANSVLLAINF